MDNQEFRYAGFWLRFAAMLIDSVIMMIIIYIPLSFIYGSEYWTTESVIAGGWDLLLNYIFPVVATVWFWLKYQGTPGKLLLKLAVVAANTGEALSTGQAVGRYFAYIISMIPFFLGFIWVAFDARKQAWHDKLSSSIVIKK